ncbi:NYN domain-containing protein [Acidisoma cellulosilytica]|uniref:NYN domain-containing protein n=1 Tax=Acidisoma cellulosilyticum TaxID=2802395 RepID=A0A964E3S3_9PROT|nr:NYN domain-containing protein [Acidisoma cellulosilyticum]MCB8880950.1 NYN domain-containing protein [Acidisoma cellulosilyticum]
MIRSVVMIDGGHLRVLARKNKRIYDPVFIEKLAHACADPTQEALLRILYYDCAPYVGQARLPVSGAMVQFTGSGDWLRDLARRDLFAVREGVLKFRGFKPKRVPISPAALSDDDFRPDFEQKGVDMRIGLDIATYSDERLTDRIILITGDTDCIPAMKHGRKSGIQMVLISLPGQRLAPELFEHADFKRTIAWPV